MSDERVTQRARTQLEREILRIIDKTGLYWEHQYVCEKIIEALGRELPVQSKQLCFPREETDKFLSIRNHIQSIQGLMEEGKIIKAHDDLYIVAKRLWNFAVEMDGTLKDAQRNS